MSTDDDVTNTSENQIHISEIECDSNDKNCGNIIIEVSELCSPEIHQMKTENNSDNATDVDTPEFITLGTYKSEDNNSENVDQSSSVALCETLYESEQSNDFNNAPLDDNSDCHFLNLIETQSEPEGNIIEDIPNEVLVYSCQPESNKPLEMFTCKSCGMVTGCVFCLKSHYESVHLNLGLIQYKCEQTSYLKNYTEICHKCNLVCESKQEMFDHRKIHFVSCDVCDMSFDSALFLSNHCKTTHDKFEVIISCDLCEQWFKQLQDLSDHYQEYHEMILCIVCFKRFSDITELTQHHRTHKIILTNLRPILPYACSKCNQAFGEISELSSHLVKDHPNRKATYGSITQRKTTPKVKQKKKKVIHFDDCGGLSQNDIEDLDEEGNVNTSTKKTRKKMKKNK